MIYLNWLKTKMNNTILKYFENTVANNPNKVAIVDRENNISFSELQRKSKILALEIIRLSKNKKKPISVFLSKSIETIFCDIGIIYSGNIYVNLDTKSPNERIKKINNFLDISLVITDTKHLSVLDTKDIHFLNLDDIDFNKEYDFSELDTFLSCMIDTDPLCIINTSGSTGIPKGVVLNHRNFIDYTINSIEIFNLSDYEIVGSLSPPIFDHYSFEICMMMFKSSTLILIPNDLSSFPVEIIKILSEKKVTFIFWVPTIMVNIANLDLLNHTTLNSLKTIWFAGEVFPTKQFNYWMKNLPSATFANLYGPTEITVDCTYFIVDRKLSDCEPIPIGKAYQNTDILILDHNDNLITQTNTEGELCVRGSSLAMGYYNDFEKTRKVFTQNPLNNSYPELIYRTGDIVIYNENNELIYKGRKDSMIKHQGYRIELMEIEHEVLNTLKLVKNACVVYQTLRKEITLFYESNIVISSAEFRKQISTVLPKYMIPTVYIRLDEMPRNTNGKIDRLLLKNQIN